MRRLTFPALSFMILSACGDKTVDLDSDGFPAEVDCDDTDAAAYPGAEEVCDDVDNDCNGEVDDAPTDGNTWYADADGDGYGSTTFPSTSTCEYTPPSGYVDNNEDCNDSFADASPIGVEVCDGLDNDCNGSIDDFALDPQLWYYDADGDGYGDPSTSQQLCDPPSGWVDNGTDCDDTDAEINPGQEWYVDADQDGFGNPDYRLAACGEQVGFSPDNTDCDDGDEAINPDADEICDEVDNNCDEAIDEDTATDAPTWYVDDDEDGYGDVDSGIVQCEQPSEYIDVGGDCADDDEEINPGVPDWCDDGIDNNCDSNTDINCAISAADSDVRIVGENSLDYLGGSMSTAGDYNGDGVPDLLIGAHLNDDGASSAGKAYLILGPISSDTSIDDSVLTITGDDATDYTGYQVALAGDVDNDGHDEVLVSAYLADLDSSTSSSGAAYLVYGPTTGDLDPDDVDATITGVAAINNTGQYELGVAGDLNDDGYDDVFVGAIYYDGDYTYGGMLSVHYGPVTGTVDLEDGDVQIHGSNNNRYVGYSSEFVDFDGDGVLDAFYGEPTANTVYGLTGPLSGDLTASDATVSIASGDSDYTGSQIESGDFDNDGHIDLIIGAHRDDSYTENGGQVSLVYGPISGSMAISSASFSVLGEGTNHYLGHPNYQIGVGDIDGDGNDDAIIGSPFNDLASNNAGAGFLFYGPMSGTDELAVETADIIIVGEASSDAVGWASEFTDIDDDGTTDLIFSGRGGANYYGAIYVLPGSSL